MHKLGMVMGARFKEHVAEEAFFDASDSFDDVVKRLKWHYLPFFLCLLIGFAA